jgi:alpha-beta hydrolase superfamily lysophospholipase
VDTNASSTTSPAAASDGTRLLLRHWDAAGRAWASALLVHGVGEQSGRYERTARTFVTAGIDVTAFDLRGHGGSGGPRGDVERWTNYLDDIELMLARVRSAAAGRPVVLVGHSMGGLICLDYVLSDRPIPHLLVLSAPGLSDGLPRWQHAIAGPLARLVPRLALRHAWGPEALSRDPEVGRVVRDDPGCPPRATVRVGAFAFGAQKRVRAGLERVTLPTFVVHGGDDRLVPASATEALEGLPNVMRRVYPGLRHETFNEPEGPQVAAEVVEWLRASVRDGAGAMATKEADRVGTAP